MFLPTTRKEMDHLGWTALDVILVTGDTYIDSPFIGVALIGKLLVRAGYRVGIIAQPQLNTDQDITRLGEPLLFWGISGGSIDSMVANFTASGKRRKSDDYTPGGINNRRPNRAIIAYANLIKQYFKNTVPLVLGGIEASLRRIAHYDAWDKSIRRSVLLDAKADYLLFGMADQSILDLAMALKQGSNPATIPGLAFLTSQPPEQAVRLPSFEEVAHDANAFHNMFQRFYEQNDPIRGQRVTQAYGKRYLILNPPPLPLTTKELDVVYALDFERAVHPYYARSGTVPALETIRFALTTHRGCYGECNFCAIAVHQGRIIQNRSVDSLVKEAQTLSHHPAFKGMLADVGGPTANMYGFDCRRKKEHGACSNKHCLFPTACPQLKINHGPLIHLLQKLRAVPGIKKIAVASGIRYDMILADPNNGERYLRDIVKHHVSGQMKIAPEHVQENVLTAMGKPGPATLVQFRRLFQRINNEQGRRQFLTYYMIAAHPGCTLHDMKQLREFCQKELHILPRQVQIFTPTPCTWSTTMYWTGRTKDGTTPCFVEKNQANREQQKHILAKNAPGSSRRPGKKQRAKK